MCCDMLGIEIELVRELCQTTTPSCNIHKCCMKNLTIFKFEPTAPNMSQHVATRWPNARNMLHPTMLCYVALKCSDRLAGALENHSCTLNMPDIHWISLQLQCQQSKIERNFYIPITNDQHNMLVAESIWHLPRLGAKRLNFANSVTWQCGKRSLNRFHWEIK